MRVPIQEGVGCEQSGQKLAEVAPSLIHMCLNVCQRTAITQLFISAHEKPKRRASQAKLYGARICEPARQLQGVGHRSIRVTAADQDGICIDGAVRTPPA